MLDLESLHKVYLKSLNYVARDDLLHRLEWRPGNLRATVYETNQANPFIAVIVGRVAEHRLRVSGSGSYFGYGEFSKTKYQLYLTRPLGSPFQKDFETGFSFLSDLQDRVTSRPNKKDLLAVEAGSNMIRFTMNVFEKRERNLVLASPVYLSDFAPSEGVGVPSSESPQGKPDKLDDFTRDWVVQADHTSLLQKIQHSHRACPLPVYRDNLLVDPSQLERILPNALVEISFTIHHSQIRLKDVDSFAGQIVQVVILKEETPDVGTPRDLHAGPLETLQCSPTIKLPKRSANAIAGPSNSDRTGKKSRVEGENDDGGNHELHSSSADDDV